LRRNQDIPERGHVTFERSVHVRLRRFSAKA
jgi:hypothetical protein